MNITVNNTKKLYVCQYGFYYQNKKKTFILHKKKSKIKKEGDPKVIFKLISRKLPDKKPLQKINKKCPQIKQHSTTHNIDH